MDDINAMLEINYVTVFIGLIVIFCVIKFLWELIDFLISKFGIEFKKVRINKEEHELLVNTINEVNLLKQSQEENKAVEEQRYNEIDSTFLRISDHFKEINSKLDSMKTDTSNINTVVVELKENDNRQNQALVESMRDRIQQRCRYFTNVLHGIPENELGSLVDSLNAYLKIHGNHGLQQEVQKCIDTLPILPVTIIKNQENTNDV